MSDQLDLDLSFAPKKLVRSTDPDTSHLAAASLEPERLTRLRQEVLDAYTKHGAMNDQRLVSIVAGLGYSPSGIRTRRSELVTMGLVFDTGIREKLPSGRLAIVWGRRQL